MISEAEFLMRWQDHLRIIKMPRVAPITGRIFYLIINNPKGTEAIQIARKFDILNSNCQKSLSILGLGSNDRPNHLDYIERFRNIEVKNGFIYKPSKLGLNVYNELVGLGRHM
jgi:hypothetical protein